MRDGLVVSIVGEMMEVHGEGLVGMIWNEGGLGAIELAQEGSGGVLAVDFLTEDVGHGCFCAVGDELDGVNEVFFIDSELLEAVVLREILDQDVLGERFAVGF